jgi:capsular exopolysaccharide synthesis family protein
MATMNELSPYLKQRAVSSSGVAARNVRSPVVELVQEVREQEDAGLSGYWQVIKKQRRLIAGFSAGVVLTTVTLLFVMTPIYTAATTILIERNPPRVVDMPQAVSEPLAAEGYDYYKTQYELLKSRSLAEQVIQEQNLEKNSLLTKNGASTELFGKLERMIPASFAVSHLLPEWLPVYSKAAQPNGRELKSRFIERYINQMLEIAPVRGTNLVTVGFSSPDPELSAQVANAHAQAFIRQGLMLRTRANQEAHRFLEEKLVELKDRVENSENALNRYRRDNSILSLDNKENIVVERLADLNKRLTESEIERIGLEAQVQLIRRREYESLPAVVNSTLIQTLKDQLIRVEGEYANLSAQFKAGYPRLAQAKAQLEELRNRLHQEIRRVVEGIQSAYMAALTKERRLRTGMESQKAAAMSLKDAAVNYAILSREVDTNRQLYDSVLERMKQVGVAAELRASNVVIIDEAHPPTRPSRPKERLILLLSGVMGLLGGIGLAFFRKYLDHTFHTPEEAERVLSLPSLGLVPEFLDLNRRFVGRSAIIRGRRTPGNGESGGEMTFYPAPPDEKPAYPVCSFAPLSEVYRTLRTGILLSEMENSRRIVLFTSAVHGEGKTATVVNSAITFAEMGVRVLLIDADLRRPMCHKLLAMRKGPGVGELLAGKIKPTWAIQPTHVSNLFFIGSGSSSVNPTELVGSMRMRELLVGARRQYDYILVDSPPVMAVTDGILLSTMVDGVVLVIGGQETPQDIVKQACSRLRYARANILGLVLNRIDPQSNSQYLYDYPSVPGREA